MYTLCFLIYLSIYLSICVFWPVFLSISLALVHFNFVRNFTLLSPCWYKSLDSLIFPSLLRSLKWLFLVSWNATWQLHGSVCFCLSNIYKSIRFWHLITHKDLKCRWTNKPKQTKTVTRTKAAKEIKYCKISPKTNTSLQQQQQQWQKAKTQQKSSEINCHLLIGIWTFVLQNIQFFLSVKIFRWRVTFDCKKKIQEYKNVAKTKSVKTWLA